MCCSKYSVSVLIQLILSLKVFGIGRPKTLVSPTTIEKSARKQLAEKSKYPEYVFFSLRKTALNRK